MFRLIIRLSTFHRGFNDFTCFQKSLKSPYDFYSRLETYPYSATLNVGYAPLTTQLNITDPEEIVNNILSREYEGVRFYGLVD